METKKWPVLAQVLIGFGVIGGLINTFGGLYQKNIIMVIAGIIGLAIYWSFYKFQKWALTGLNILLSLSIAFTLLNVGRLPNLVLFLAVIYSVLIMVYFNSKTIKELLK